MRRIGMVTMRRSSGWKVVSGGVHEISVSHAPPADLATVSLCTVATTSYHRIMSLHAKGTCTGKHGGKHTKKGYRVHLRGGGKVAGTRLRNDPIKHMYDILDATSTTIMQFVHFI
jgi:hypothetical protein